MSIPYKYMSLIPTNILHLFVFDFVLFGAHTSSAQESFLAGSEYLWDTMEPTSVGNMQGK